MKDWFSVVLLVVLIIYQTYNHRDLLRKLNKRQLLGIVLTYSMAILVATIIIYYGGNWLANLFPTTLLKFIVFMVVVIVTFIGIGFVISKVLHRITGGLLSEDN